MAYIKVDHSEFNKTAKEIEKYIDFQKKNMRNIENEIISLSSSWSGTDYNQVLYESKAMNSKESTSTKMIDALSSYCDFLRFCESKYKEAQSKAINLANRLPR